MNRVKITIAYDNRAEADLARGWGFSAYVEGRETILFDTGNSGPKLLQNFDKLNIDPLAIDKIVLSHNHWDHTGGLKAVQKINKKAQVIQPGAFSEPSEISADVYTTGALGRWPKEQALVVKTSKGTIVITGCAHPGLTRILEVAAELGETYGVIGGFHGFSDFDRLAGIKLVGPCHCTRYIEEIRQRYPEQFRDIKAGSTIEI